MKGKTVMHKDKDTTKSTAKCYLVSFDFDDNGDVKIALVGQRNDKNVTEVINAFVEDEAMALYDKLTVKKLKG